MKITAVKGIPLRCACAPIHDALSTSRARQALLVRVDTDAGLYGIGEAFTYGAPLAVMRYMVEEVYGPILLGREPDCIEELWQVMYWRTIASGRRSMAVGAISGIDIALWDLRGKAEHKPISALLGAKRGSIPSYASAGFYAPNKDVDGLRRELEDYMRQGYTDAKIKIGRNLDREYAPLRYMPDQSDAVTVEEDWRRIEAAKAVVGSGRLAVDTNASWNAAMALANLPELARRGVEWLEEPIPFEDLAGYTALCAAAKKCGVQIIGCETQQTAANFETMLAVNALDIVQPDVGWAGGISELAKLGAIAHAHGRKVSLHCFGSAVLFAATLQIAAALPEIEPIESEENPNPLKTELITEPFGADEHMSWYVPQGDGLGIEVDEEKLERYAVK